MKNDSPLTSTRRSKAIMSVTTASKGIFNIPTPYCQRMMWPFITGSSKTPFTRNSAAPRASTTTAPNGTQTSTLEEEEETIGMEVSDLSRNYQGSDGSTSSSSSSSSSSCMPKVMLSPPPSIPQQFLPLDDDDHDNHEPTIHKCSQSDMVVVVVAHPSTHHSMNHMSCCCNSSSNSVGSNYNSNSKTARACNDDHTASCRYRITDTTTKTSWCVSFRIFSCCYHCHDIVQAIVSRSFYSLASISMILMNKSIDKSYHHYVDGDLSILIIILQSMIVLGCIESCRQWNRILCRSCHTYRTTSTPGSGNRTKTNRKQQSTTDTNALSLHYTTSSLGAGLFFSTMLVTGMVALHYNTLSMIIVSRNVANLVLMIGDYIAFRQYPDIYVATIYNLLLAGAIIAALQQHTFSVTRTGLIWMMANCFCTAAYILCMKHIITTTTTSATAGTYSTYPSSSSCNHNHGSLPLTQPQASGPLSGSARKSTGMIPVYSIIYIHNALCIVFLLPAAYMMGEISLFAASTAIHTTEYASKTVIAGILCFIFNYALLNCVEQQSTHPHHHSHDGTHTSTHGVPQKHRRPSLSERHSKNVLV